MCLTLPLWGEHQRAGPGEHDYSYEGQTRRTAQAQVKSKMDECCIHGLSINSGKTRFTQTTLQLPKKAKSFLRKI